MLSDKLTLALAYHYIYHIGSIIVVNGRLETAIVTDITFSYLNKYADPNTRKLVKFNTIQDVADKIDLIGSPSVVQAECGENMGVYELKSFTVITQNNSFAYVKNTASGWSCASDIISPDQINALNNEYQSTYDRTETLYLGLEYVEYIYNQNTYIDCGYIKKWFGAIIDELTRLYSTYNNTYNKDKNTL